MMIAVRALALTGLDLLTRPEILTNAKAEFARSALPRTAAGG